MEAALYHTRGLSLPLESRNRSCALQLKIALVTTKQGLAVVNAEHTGTEGL